MHKCTCACGVLLPPRGTESSVSVSVKIPRISCLGVSPLPFRGDNILGPLQEISVDEFDIFFSLDFMMQDSRSST